MTNNDDDCGDVTRIYNSLILTLNTRLPYMESQYECGYIRRYNSYLNYRVISNWNLLHTTIINLIQISCKNSVNIPIENVQLCHKCYSFDKNNNSLNKCVTACILFYVLYYCKIYNKIWKESAPVYTFSNKIQQSDNLDLTW